MNRLPVPILVATDASEDAHAAMRVAASLARRSGSPLHIVHVWQMPFTYGIPPLVVDPSLGEDAGESILEEERAVVESYGATVAGTHLRRGAPALAILAVADAMHAGVVVVGRRGLGAVRRAVLGSVSDDVVQHSDAPVLVVHGTNWPPSRVVVGADGSDEARRAADLAADVAELVGVPVTLVRALPHLAASLGGPAPCQVQVSSEEPWQALDGASQDGTALLVVGHRRPGDGSRLERHSVAERVLHHAVGSVLVVPGRRARITRGEAPLQLVPRA
ncbi:MAG TPA: universal stress protein [Candidatus Angelobacter sp.]|jgi:nucleotide-binding universal stress UspA family protein|nr:universal stress protein [Candidatus Angelobacter sp.]